MVEGDARRERRDQATSVVREQPILDTADNEHQRANNDANTEVTWEHTNTSMDIHNSCLCAPK